jgi:hypothetical protein
MSPVAATETEEPTLPLGAGIGVLAALALLLSPFLGDRLTRVATVQLASAEEGCPWEIR